MCYCYLHGRPNTHYNFCTISVANESIKQQPSRLIYFYPSAIRTVIVGGSMKKGLDILVVTLHCGGI